MLLFKNLFLNFEMYNKRILLLFPCQNEVHVQHFLDYKTFIFQRKNFRVDRYYYLPGKETVLCFRKCNRYKQYMSKYILGWSLSYLNTPWSGMCLYLNSISLLCKCSATVMSAHWYVMRIPMYCAVCAWDMLSDTVKCHSTTKERMFQCNVITLLIDIPLIQNLIF
jgi:hypothetical protein